MCNKCGLFERTHSRPRPDQFPHKRGPLAVSVSRGRTPPGNQLPPISNTPTSYQYHHAHLTPLNTAEYHSNPLPALQTWQNNSGNSSTSSNNGSTTQANNPPPNNHTEPTNLTAGPGAGSGNGNGSSAVPGSSSNPGPLLMPRRQTLDSPRMPASGTSTPRSGRPFDEPLSSNAAPPNTGGSASAVAGDSSHPHSQPPTPPSRSSAILGGAKSHEGGGSSAGHSPPAIASAGSSARDQA